MSWKIMWNMNLHIPVKTNTWKNRCWIKNFPLQHSVISQSFPLSFSFFFHSTLSPSMKMTNIKILEELSLFSGAYSKIQMKLNSCLSRAS